MARLFYGAWRVCKTEWAFSSAPFALEATPMKVSKVASLGKQGENEVDTFQPPDAEHDAWPGRVFPVTKQLYKP